MTMLHQVDTEDEENYESFKPFLYLIARLYILEKCIKMKLRYSLKSH